MVEFALVLVPGLSGEIVRGRVTNIVSDTELRHSSLPCDDADDYERHLSLP